MKTRRGSTLMELIIVLVIITTLAGILLPVLWRARMAGLDTECKNNMKQIGTALMMYRDAFLATNREWHPRTLHHLYPDYLPQKDVLICPRDDFRGGQGGRPNGVGDQYEELDEGSSYMYEFNMNAECSWGWVSYLGLGSHPSPGAAIDIDGVPTKSMWGEVKTYQLKHGDGYHNGPYSPTRFPIIRCFWHTNDPNTSDLKIQNLSYMCNFFRSGSLWEETSE